jgi:hypothetical protein
LKPALSAGKRERERDERDERDDRKGERERRKKKTFFFLRYRRCF